MKRISHAIHLGPGTGSLRLTGTVGAVAATHGKHIPHLRISADSREFLERNLETVSEHIVALEAIHAVAVLAEAIGETAIIVEESRCEQVEDRGSIGVETVVARTAEYGDVVLNVVDALLRVGIQIGRGGRAGYSLLRWRRYRAAWSLPPHSAAEQSVARVISFDLPIPSRFSTR